MERFGVHIDQVERDLGVIGDGATVVAVADDRGDLDRQFVQLRAPQDLIEAVVGLGDENSGPHLVGQATEVPVCLKAPPKVPKPTLWRFMRFRHA